MSLFSGEVSTDRRICKRAVVSVSRECEVLAAFEDAVDKLPSTPTAATSHGKSLSPMLTFSMSYQTRASPGPATTQTLPAG